LLEPSSKDRRGVCLVGYNSGLAALLRPSNSTSGEIAWKTHEKMEILRLQRGGCFCKPAFLVKRNLQVGSLEAFRRLKFESSMIHWFWCLKRVNHSLCLQICYKSSPTETSASPVPPMYYQNKRPQSILSPAYSHERHYLLHYLLHLHSHHQIFITNLKLQLRTCVTPYSTRVETRRRAAITDGSSSINLAPRGEASAIVPSSKADEAHWLQLLDAIGQPRKTVHGTD